jgi:hypothetical protein
MVTPDGSGVKGEIDSDPISLSRRLWPGDQAMSERMKAVWRFIVLYGIVAGLVLALPACTDVAEKYLCRPAYHCPDVDPKGGRNAAGQ